MNLAELLKYVNAKLNKNQSGNITNMDRFNTFLDSANILLFNMKAGLPEDYRPGQVLTQSALDISQIVSEDLRFCRVRLGGNTPPLKVHFGFARIPEDFIRLGSIIFKYTDDNDEVHETPVEVIFDNDWGVRLNSEIMKPDYESPIARFGSDLIEVRPKGVSKLDLTYYRLPKTPYFDYTIKNDVPVYLPPNGKHDGTVKPEGTPSASVELEWPENIHLQFARIVANEFSVTIKDQFVYQDTEKSKQTGR